MNKDISILYHYTSADRLVKILASGYLKLCPKEPEPNEKQFVWLTTSDEWDRTAFYGYPMNVLDHAGRIRITINAEAIKLHTNKAEDIKEDIYNWDNLVNTAHRVFVNEKNWVLSDRIITVSAIIDIETWNVEKQIWDTLSYLNGTSYGC